MALTIDTYTANWDRASYHAPTLRKGMLVRISESADAREWDGFRSALKSENLELSWEHWMPRAKLNVYRLVAAQEN